MLDPLLEKLDIEIIDESSEGEYDNMRLVTKEKLLKFNPYYSLCVPGLPDSFYAVLSIFKNFSLVSCNQLIHNEGCVCIDLDNTPGFIMATQGRYPDTQFYSMSTKDFDEERSGVILLNVHSKSITYRDLLDYSIESNPRGVDFGFCSAGLSIDETLQKLKICIAALKHKGSLIVYFPDTTTVIECSEPLLNSFESVTPYKPATSSIVSQDLYLVCRRKLSNMFSSTEEPKIDHNITKKLNEFESECLLLEEWRIYWLKCIISGIDNTSRCDVESAKIDYLSL
jgi:hypothetical protein